MIHVLAALLLAAASPGDPVGERIAASSRAAQTLQGPLDGAWTLRNDRGATLLMFQFVDQPGGGGVSAAWRKPENAGATGYVDGVDRTPDRLVLRLQADAATPIMIIRLRRAGSDFTGEIGMDGRRERVRLTRTNEGR